MKKYANFETKNERHLSFLHALLVTQKKEIINCEGTVEFVATTCKNKRQTALISTKKVLEINYKNNNN